MKLRFTAPPSSELCSTAWLRKPLPDTNFELNHILIGISYARWGAQPFIVHPFRYPEAACNDMEAQPDIENTSEFGILNPVRLALEWQAMLAKDKALTKAEIARKTDVSRARVTQIMNLLNLPKDILAHFSSPPAGDDLRPFSERNLRNILAMKNTAARLTAFQQLRQQRLR